MSSDLSKLTDAADKWVEMAGKFKTIEEQYERDVHGVSLGPSWVGQSADAANYRFTVTLKELQGAQEEAKAIASILRDSHTQLAARQGEHRARRRDQARHARLRPGRRFVRYRTAQPECTQCVRA
ncbi:hypothetical protein OOK43_10460 [[Kitasatospora] papulosa]|uniref:hypothetical protein n=1 Tax=[Kitasatospora] papulosa TaxID=1464011 RepID=UPI0022597C18|nr:hypothetical protein [[Kitasatospora] papulosa]MCX4413698.1 hypothetical protein [[Kitasatospora] papulosa]